MSTMTFDRLRAEWQPPPEPAQPTGPEEIPGDSPSPEPSQEPLGIPEPPPDDVPFEPGSRRITAV